MMQLFAAIYLLAYSGASSATKHDPARQFGLRIVAGTAPTADPNGLQFQANNSIEPRHLPLQRITGLSLKQQWLQVASDILNGVHLGSENPGEVNATTRIKYLHSSQYVGNISVGSQEFQVVLDTGSSDTWIVHESFSCVDYDDRPISKNNCPFGPPFRGTFKYGATLDVSFSISYGDGELVHGPAGLDDVTIAGITVKKQQVGLANRIYGGGDGVTSGLLGMAYPILTQAFNGTNGKQDQTPGSPGQRAYDPVFTSMVKQGLVVPPYFSMSMDRNNTGWLTLGGLPPVPHGRFSSAPIRKAQVVNISTLATEYSFYTVVADDYVLGDHNASGINIPGGAWTEALKGFPLANAFPVVVDSGSTLASLPTAHAEAFTAQFNPPAVYNAFTAEYWAPCTAKVPHFGVAIGGQTFFASPEDLLQQEVRLDWNGDGKMFCRVGVKDGYGGPFILGDVFLNSVIAVYDLSINEMHFAPRL